MDAAAGPSGVDMKKKPMLDQVCEAIKTIGKPRIGASVVAIKKHILDSYDESQHGRMFNQLKKAIIQGEESGMLVRPARCKNSVGATGSFLLKAQKSKTEVDKSEKPTEEKVKKMKKLFESEDTKVVQKTTKSQTTKAKNPKKKEGENEDGPSVKTTKPKTTKAKVSKMEEEENEDAPPEKTTKPKNTKVKNPKKKEEENEDGYSEDFNTSTPKSSSSGGEQKLVRPRALVKKAVKGSKNDTFTMKKHASDSELTDVKQKTVQRKTLKEKPKTTTKNSKPGTSNSMKETEKPSGNNEKKKTRRVLKSYNSDSVLMEK